MTITRTSAERDDGHERLGRGERPVPLAEYYAIHYAKDDRPEVRPVALIVRAMEELRPLRSVLDVGCGDGSLSQVYALHSERFVGVEISMDGCRAVSAKGLSVVRADVENSSFPFQAGSFDLVIAGEIIEHMTDPDHFLYEMVRVLKPHGHCIVTTPNLASWYNRILLMMGYQPYHTDVSFWHQVGKIRPIVDGGSGHLRVFTLRALRELLEIHHLRPLAVEGFGVPVSVSNLFNLMDRALSNFPSLSSYLVILSRLEGTEPPMPSRPDTEGRPR